LGTAKGLVDALRQDGAAGVAGRCGFDSCHDNSGREQTSALSVPAHFTQRIAAQLVSTIDEQVCE
ncbi:MAG: hypothetical protein WD425_04305, partial [Nitrospirales bacterium]